mgnify:CR=1 FL=1|jgi:muramoyltetrapeptide carboxypeptidase
MNDLIKPKRLKYNSTIGIVTTSLPLNIILNDYIKQGTDKIKSLGYKIKFGKNCFSENNEYQNIEKRIDDFHDMVEDPKINLIMCIIGGFSANGMLDKIDYSLIKKNKKSIIGYSDNTIITLAVNKISNITTFNGPMFVNFCPNDINNFTINSFQDLLMKDTTNYNFNFSTKFADDDWYLKKPSLANNRNWKNNKGLKTYRHGNAKGKIIAGNLNTLAIMNNTKYEPNYENSILFIEEADYQDYLLIGRNMTYLKQTNVFEKINGLVIGRFPTATRMNEKKLFDLLDLTTKNYDFPIIFNVDFGHTDPILTIPNGIKCEINTNPCYIQLLETATK